MKLMNVNLRLRNLLQAGSRSRKAPAEVGLWYRVAVAVGGPQSAIQGPWPR